MGHITRLLKKRRAALVASTPPTSSAIAYATANSLNLEHITGTGKGGRIILADVRAYHKSITEESEPTGTPAGEGSASEEE